MRSWVLAMWLLSAGLAAQQETATLTGIVTDPTGAAVADATVVATQTSTGVLTRTTTNHAGVYTLANLRVGPYSVSVEKAGFRKYVQVGLTLQVNQTARVDVTVQLGQQSEEVRVVAEVPMLETESASRGAVIDRRRIVDLPLNGRDYNHLALLSPGVLPATPRFSVSTLQFKGAFNANGNRVFMNAYLLDGLDNVSYSTGYRGENVQVVQPSVDALAEFKIQTANYSAEFGRSAGAIVNAVIRSGSNRFHGTLYEFLRNEALDANNFFANFAGRDKPPLKRNQFGGSVGGPVKRNKTHFFADYEGLRDREGVPRFLNVPTAAMKSGNFQGVAALTDPTVSGRPPFPNNTIPTTKHDPVGVRLLSTLPDPTGPGLSNNYFRTTVNRTRTDQFDARVDHQIAPRLNSFARYSFVDTRIDRPSPMPGLGEGSFSDTFGLTQNRSQSVATAATWNINAAAVLDGRFGYTRGSYRVAPPNAGGPCPSELLGISTPAIDSQYCGGLPKIRLTGYSDFGRSTSTPQFQVPEAFNARASVNALAGQHLLKAGAEWLFVRTPILDIGQLIGNFGFDGAFTGDPIADILLGMPRTFSMNNPVVFHQSQRLQFYYVQDDWKIHPKLTLNVGLRYEQATPPREENNRMANFDPAGGSYVQLVPGGPLTLFPGIFVLPSGSSGAAQSLIRGDNNDFAPRFGFAWMARPKTVIRGGYGIFYNHTNRQGTDGLLEFNLPALLEPTFPATSAPAFLLRNGYPSGILDPARINDPIIATTSLRRAQQIDQRSPYVQQWSVGAQREFRQDFLLEASYVATKGTKLPGFRNLNYATPAPFPGPTVQPQARRVYPQFGDIQYMENRVNTNFHSLQLRLEKRFSFGFSGSASYTWGKVLGNGVDNLSTAQAATPGVDVGASRDVQDPRNARLDYGPSEFDITHRVVFNYVWQLPFGRDQRWFGSLRGWPQFFLGGWQINGITTFQTGLPLTMVLTSTELTNLSMGGERARRPDVTGPLVPSGFRQNIDHWFDTSKLVVPNSAIGNSGVGVVRGPGTTNVDFSFFKNYELDENRRFQFRLETFNALNRANFGQPALSFDGTRTGTGLGTIRATNTPARIIQFGLKLYF